MASSLLVLRRRMRIATCVALRGRRGHGGVPSRSVPAGNSEKGAEHSRAFRPGRGDQYGIPGPTEACSVSLAQTWKTPAGRCDSLSALVRMGWDRGHVRIENDRGRVEATWSWKIRHCRRRSRNRRPSHRGPLWERDPEFSMLARRVLSVEISGID